MRKPYLVPALAMLIICTPAAAQPVPATDPPTVVRTVAVNDDRVSIPIHIDGRGPWNFIIDTGSQRTVISRNLADHLALPSRRQVTIVSMAGRSTARTVESTPPETPSA